MCKGATSFWSRKWGDGTAARLPELAVELVNSGVDLIVTDGGSTTRAVHALTSTIPIVMASSADPLWVGAVQSLSRPGGNVTGLTSLAAGISGKVFEIFKELIPGRAPLIFCLSSVPGGPAAVHRADDIKGLRHAPEARAH